MDTGSGWKKKKEGEQDRERTGSTTQPTTRDEKSEGAQAIMDQLAPLLEGWLRTNLMSMGIQFTGKKKIPDPPAWQKAKGGDKTKGNPNPPLRSKAPGIPAAEEGARGSTTTPNMKLWSDVAGEKARDRGSTTLLTNQRTVTNGAQTKRRESVPPSPIRRSGQKWERRGNRRRTLPRTYEHRQAKGERSRK